MALPSLPPHSEPLLPPTALPCTGKTFRGLQTLQAAVIRVLRVFKQGGVIPIELRVSPTFLATHGAGRGGGGLQGCLRLSQVRAGQEVP